MGKGKGRGVSLGWAAGQPVPACVRGYVVVAWLGVCRRASCGMLLSYALKWKGRAGGKGRLRSAKAEC